MINQIIEAYRVELKKYCYTLAGTPWDGNDLYQNAVVKLLKNPNPIETHPNPKGYMFKTATNVWRDTLRKSKWEEITSEDAIELPILDNSLLETIEVLLTYLSFKQSSTFLLVEYYGFSMVEVAEMLNMTEG
ncbi:RNA polymerase sigma factor [Pontibacillus marinus]|nr:RNA polymerase sigma factor [Pontibacillus marinus]